MTTIYCDNRWCMYNKDDICQRTEIKIHIPNTAPFAYCECVIYSQVKEVPHETAINPDIAAETTHVGQEA